MAEKYETEDGEPRYGVRLSPEELAAYYRDQGLEPSAGAEVSSAGDGAELPASAPWGAPPVGGTGTDDDPYRFRGPSPAYGTARPAPASSQAQPAGRRRLPVLGPFLMLVLPVILLVSAVVLAIGGSLSSGAVLASDGAVYLAADEQVGLYAASSSTDPATCTVTSPSGTARELTGIAPETPYASFTTAEAGTYAVSCPGGTQGVVVGPPVRASRLPLAGTLMLGAMLSGAAGLVVTIVQVVRRSQARAPRR